MSLDETQEGPQLVPEPVPDQPPSSSTEQPTESAVEAEPATVDEVASILEEYHEAKQEQEASLGNGFSDSIDPAKRDEVLHGIGCAYCDRTAHTQCYVCLKYFCSDHRTKDDAFLCTSCSASPNELRPHYAVGPLVDDDGVTHDGKHITPIGDTYQVSHYIDSLSDAELLAMMAEYQRLVKQAEQLLYSRIIVSNTISGAIGERTRKKRLEGRAGRLVKAKDGSKSIEFPGSASAAKVKAKQPQASVADTLIAALTSMPQAERDKLLAMLKK